MLQFRRNQYFDLVLCTSCSAQPCWICRSGCTKYQIEMLISPELTCITRRYVQLQTSSSGFVLYLSMYHCSTVPTEYVLVCTCNSKTFASMYQYVLGLHLVCTQKTNTHNVRNWTKDLMHSILSFHFMVISLVDARYIHSKIYTGVACYLLSWLVLDVLHGSSSAPWCHWSGHDRLEFTGCPCWLSKRWTLKAQVGC